jgi:hypothetical protein
MRCNDSEIGLWTILKSLGNERICHFCDTKNVEDEKKFLLKCLRIPKLDHNFKISITIPTFLTF